jgi:hypothetical protein
LARNLGSKPAQWSDCAHTPPTNEVNLLDHSCGRIFLDTITTILLIAALLFVVAAGTAECYYNICDSDLSVTILADFASLICCLLDLPVFIGIGEFTFHFPFFGASSLARALLLRAFFAPFALYSDALSNLDRMVIGSVVADYLDAKHIFPLLAGVAPSLFFLVRSVSTRLAGFRLSLPSFGDSGMPCLPIHCLIVTSELTADTLSHDASLILKLMSCDGNLVASPPSFKEENILLSSAATSDPLPMIHDFAVPEFCAPLHLMLIVASSNIDRISSIVASLMSTLTIMSTKLLCLLLGPFALHWQSDVLFRRSFCFSTQHAGLLAPSTAPYSPIL